MVYFQVNIERIFWNGRKILNGDMQLVAVSYTVPQIVFCRWWYMSTAHLTQMTQWNTSVKINSNGRGSGNSKFQKVIILVTDSLQDSGRLLGKGIKFSDVFNCVIETTIKKLGIVVVKGVCNKSRAEEKWGEGLGSKFISRLCYQP